MARSTVVEHRLTIHKSDEKGSAYLFVYDRDVPLERNEDGVLSVELDDLFGSGEVSAWSTLTNAKRAAAARVSRQRLKWDEAPAETGGTNWTCVIAEKVY